MSSPPRSEAPALGVVFVQSEAGDGALARVLAHLASIGVADASVAIVDERRPGDWEHAISSRLVHLGAGDAPARGVVETVLRGVERIPRHDDGREPEIVLIAGERFWDLDDPALELLDAYALETCSRAGVALGWLRAGTDPLERGMALLPLAATSVLRGAAEAGAGVAPPPGLAERLRAGGVELIDLRLVRRLREGMVQPGALDGAALARLAALGGGDPGERPRIQPAGWIDHAELPETVRHGERAAIVVRGWVIDSPMPHRVLFRAAGREMARVDLGVRRADVFAANPGLDNEVCGFELIGRIGPLPPGVQELDWVAEGSHVGGRVGSLRVLPTHTLEVSRVLAPARRPVDVPPVVVVEGRVAATEPQVSLDVRVGGERLAVRRQRPLPGGDRDRPTVIEFLGAGRVTSALRSRELEVEVRSADISGGSDLVVRRVASLPDPTVTVPASVARREVGHFEPRRGTTPLELRGMVFGAQPSDRVGLLVNGKAVAKVPLATLDVGDATLGVASFAIEERSTSVEAGELELELVLLGASSGRGTIERWRQTVLARPVLVDPGEPRLERRDPRGNLFRLVLEGRLEGADQVDSLALAIDGVVRTRLGGEWLIPADVSDGPAASWHRFRFDSDLPLEAGSRRLEIRIRRGAVESAPWQGSLEVPPPAEPVALRIRCAELDRLLREDAATVGSRLRFDGQVIGDVASARAVLELAGRRVAEAPLAGDGAFRLEARPPGGGGLEGALEIEARGTTLLRSPTFHVHVRPLALPAGAAEALRRLLPTLLPAGPSGLAAEPEEVLRRALERRPGAAGDFVDALGALARRAEEAETRPARIVEGELPALDRRLRVLLASWEIPSSRSGGGVCMVNLLRHLGERHEVTLLHSLAPGEEGLSEQVRPCVREILTARRDWRPEAPDREFGVPEAFARNASRRARELVEVEAASGSYDLVNYEFNPMMMHASTWRVPSLGVFHEVHGFALAAGAPERFGDADEAAAWLEGVIGALHFETSTLAGRIPELAVLTRPEAELLARFLPGRRIFVNPIPIDVAGLAAAASAATRSTTPTFVFVGNYVHPPNREAAAIFAGRIAPAVLAARPDSRFLVVGAGAPPEVHALARPGLEIAGFVPDLASLLGGATAFLAPLFTGGGMRVKLLEAMACGCPVVSSTLGLAGIGVEPGRDALVADSVDDFVAAAVRLADNPPLVRRLAEAGRAVVERDHGIAVQGDRRERIWRAVLDGAAGREPAS